MALDYKSIAKKHKEEYGTAKSHLRIYKQLYSDKTHFIYELVQNADDNKSRHLELQLVRMSCSFGMMDVSLAKKMCVASVR